MSSKRFKPGDKIRCLRNSGGGYSKGKIYTVKSYTDEYLYTIVDDKNSTCNGWLGKYFELASELDQLCEIINESNAALRKVLENHIDEYEIYNTTNNVVHQRVDFNMCDHYQNRGYSILKSNFKFRPKAKPEFKPIKSKHGVITITGDILAIGCKCFKVTLVKNVLTDLITKDGGSYADEATNQFFAASKEGIRLNADTMPWNEAEELLKELENAGY